MRLRIPITGIGSATERVSSIFGFSDLILPASISDLRARAEDGFIERNANMRRPSMKSR